MRGNWKTSVLAAVLALGVLAGGLPVSAIEQQTPEQARTAVEAAQAETDNSGETNVETGGESDGAASDETGGEVSGEPAEGEFGVSLMALNAAEAATAVVRAPDALALDGSKEYLIFTPCLWGGQEGEHTYAIGPDAYATGNLGIAAADRTPGSEINLAQADLGWTLCKTDAGLEIKNQAGGYLIVAEDGTLAVSTEEKASGFVIDSTGALCLTDDAAKSVYLQQGNVEPAAGQAFRIAGESTKATFYFAEVQQPAPPEPAINTKPLFPALLPDANFRAEIVSPDAVYGDDQYVIFTEKAGAYYAVTGAAAASTPLTLDAAAAVGVRLSSPDTDVLWTVNNNRAKPAADGSGYHKYIRNCATNGYLAPTGSLLSAQISDAFYLAEKDGATALIATGDGSYVVLDGDHFTLTGDKNAANRFYFAKLLQQEQQTQGETTPIPRGTLLRLVDWSGIQAGKQYAILNATELNKMHYALSGNGRTARYGADNLTNYDLCPKSELNGVYGAAPCESQVKDIFYTNAQNILWTASKVADGRAAFQNAATGLYLKPAEGPAAGQTPSISAEEAVLTIEPVAGKAYAYLHSGDAYLGLWQYVCVAVGKTAPERCAFYLAEVLDPAAGNPLPATSLTPDPNPNTYSFGGLYSIYHGSQHLLNNGTGVANYILMKDGSDSFRPEGGEYTLGGENNYTVTYCADYETDMPVFSQPGQYTAVDLAEYDGFGAEQKAALAAMIPNCYPYVAKDEFLTRMKNAGYTVSENCGTDEILAGVQAAIYNITNPKYGQWGYESSDGWMHNSYETNKPQSYVADPAKAEADVNAVRDYLWSFVAPAATMAEGVTKTGDSKYFALTTEVDGKTMALTFKQDDGFQVPMPYLAPYDPNDVAQMWCEDEHGSLQWYPIAINGSCDAWAFLGFENGNRSYQFFLAWLKSDFPYIVEAADNGETVGFVPLKLDESGHLIFNDYDKKLDPYRLELKNDGVGLYFNKTTPTAEGEFLLSVLPLFEEWPSPLPSEVGIAQTFTKAEVAEPVFENYDLKTDDVKIAYNQDGSYNAAISGSLTFPTQPTSDMKITVWCNNEQIGTVPAAQGEQKFTATAKNIPDTAEAHFWIKIEQQVTHVAVYVSDDGGQLQIGTTTENAVYELHLTTTSLPAQKVWGDDKDHSADSVELCLTEGDAETPYRLTLNAENNWQGTFKHVLYEVWECVGFEEASDISKVPLKTHEYTIKELNVKPGYTPVYSVVEPEKPEEPAVKDYKVQVVFELTETDINNLAGTSSSGSLPNPGTYALGLGGFAPYKQAEESQCLYLNGDNINGNNALIARFEIEKDIFAYQLMNLEKADEPDKYYLYSIDPFDGKLYYKLTLSSYNQKLIPETVDTKDDAQLFELRDVETGTALAKIPEDSFQPIETPLYLYENGQKTEYVFTFDYNLQPPLSIQKYIPDNPFQNFTVCCYDGQLVAFSGLIPELGFVLEPCGGAPEQYWVGIPEKDYTTRRYSLYYLEPGQDGVLSLTKNKEDALHFGLADTTSAGGVDLDPILTVTNVPNPEPAPTPSAPPAPSAPSVPPAPDEQPRQAKQPSVFRLPATGDASSPVLWLVLAIVSAGGLGGLALYKKRRGGSR